MSSDGENSPQTIGGKFLKNLLDEKRAKTKFIQICQTLGLEDCEVTI
jgi:hypothetical protein